MLKLWNAATGLPSPQAGYHPDNYRQVYAEHGGYTVDPQAVAALHGLMAVVFRPRVTFGEGVEQQVGQWLAEGRPVVSVTNHQHYFDHFVDAAATQRTPSLRPISQRGFPLAKVEYFDLGEEPPLTDQAVSFFYRLLRSCPAYREQDLRQMVAPADFRRAFTNTNKAMVDTVVDMMAQPESKIPHIYPEGTRQRGDWSRVGPVLDGVGRILVEATRRGLEPGLLVAARSYGVKTERPWQDINWRRPQLHFGDFLTGPFEKRVPINRLVPELLQANLDEAHARALDHA